MIFFFYKLTDVEARYRNSKYDCLTGIGCLTEVKWLIINNPYKILIYLDYCTLQDIFFKGNSKKNLNQCMA